jgi:hypothetical protein
MSNEQLLIIHCSLLIDKGAFPATPETGLCGAE